MRKLAAALLAVPVIAVLYLPVLVRRSVAARIGLAIGVGGLVAVGAFGLVSPTRTTATKPLPAIVPLTQAAFTSAIVADQELDAPVDLAFSGPMDKRSVAASIDVSPRTAVHLSWDATRSRLTVSPAGGWLAGTYYTVTVRAGALGESGRPMAVPARAVFLTRQATTGRIAPTLTAGGEVPVTTGFSFIFDRPVAIGAVRKALTIDPPLRGALDIAPSAPGTSAFVFTPVELLRTSTQYTVGVGALVDSSGAPLAEVPAVSVRTTAAPEVVRFRPKHGTSAVARTAKLSVRFTQSMDQATTKAAWVVTANGEAVAGTVSFAEKDTVLVFTPKGPLPYGAEVMLLVKAAATSATGAPLAEARSVRFRVEPQPAPPAPRSSGSGGSSGGSGGGSVGGGSWAAVESYYLRLMNCTRTGGLVTSSGSCSSPGGRNVAALWIDSGISSKVARPYAKRLAVNNQCSHFIGGNPGDRLRAAGYSSYIWAENLGCRSGDPYAAVLGSHLFFQSERSYNGGHYVNMMNSKYDRVGIGVWVSGGRVRLVIDFYHPR
ncbi:MAG TPA: Ig-like domain-containing protein [Candidatus Limnocylindrales bacterium]|nr:Ig-like domain-containing protein [Candidatus Limnocylindrales bacterium]